MEEKLIKSKERVEKYAEVYTPAWVVKDMCDMLGEEAWTDVRKTFLEPTCGNGQFLVEILRRKLDNSKTDVDRIAALLSIYAVDILPDNVAESKERMLSIVNEKCPNLIGYATEIFDKQIICADSLKQQELWWREELDKDLITLAEYFQKNLKVKDKPDKNGKIVSVIEIHDNVPMTDYLEKALVSARLERSNMDKVLETIRM